MSRRAGFSLNYSGKQRGGKICVYNPGMSLAPEIEALRNKLMDERLKSMTALETVTPAEMWNADNGGWSVKDILAHVTNAEQLNMKFTRLMLEGDKPIQLIAFRAEYPDYAGAFELDRFNAYMYLKLRDVPLETILRDLADVRAATLAWIETLTPDVLDLLGEHAAWGPQSVRGMLKILMLHDKMHTQEIMKRIQVRG